MKQKKEEYIVRQMNDLYDYFETISKQKPDGEFDRGMKYGLEHSAQQLKKIIDNKGFRWSKEEYLATADNIRKPQSHSGLTFEANDPQIPHFD